MLEWAVIIVADGPDIAGRDGGHAEELIAERPLVRAGDKRPGSGLREGKRGGQACDQQGDAQREERLSMDRSHRIPPFHESKGNSIVLQMSTMESWAGCL